MTPSVILRAEPRADDAKPLQRLLEDLGFFQPWEIDVALELLHDRLRRGATSDYHFILADVAGELAGFCCYGPIAVAPGRFDLYWIARSAAHPRLGLGSRLLVAAEEAMRAAGGTICYIETSSRPLYAPTHGFYRKHAYAEVARVPRYYADDDDRIIYMKPL